MISVRRYTLADFDQLVRIQRECFPPPFPAELWWRREQIASQLQHFPAGALCAVEGDELVGSATCSRIRFDPAHPRHTWAEVADDGYIRTCDPTGDTLYGIDVAVRPAWRGRGVARALYQARFALVRELGLQRFLAGSRISGYHRFRELTAEQYAAEVVAGRLMDPVITPQLKAGLQPVCVLPEYVPDEESRNYALLMQWLPTASARAEGVS
jgi:ribosomal protein S18 acetylase RimI-like enzyme